MSALTELKCVRSCYVAVRSGATGGFSMRAYSTIAGSPVLEKAFVRALRGTTSGAAGPPAAPPRLLELIERKRFRV